MDSNKSRSDWSFERIDDPPKLSEKLYPILTIVIYSVGLYYIWKGYIPYFSDRIVPSNTLLYVFSLFLIFYLPIKSFRYYQYSQSIVTEAALQYFFEYKYYKWIFIVFIGPFVLLLQAYSDILAYGWGNLLFAFGIKISSQIYKTKYMLRPSLHSGSRVVVWPNLVHSLSLVFALRGIVFYAIPIIEKYL